MRRIRLLATAFFLVIGLAGGWMFARAQESTPELPQGAVGVTAAVLGAFPVNAAPGYDLQVFRSEWAPGSSISMHAHPGALVSCVESGTLSFAIQTGAATVIRQHGAGTPAPVEEMVVGQPITYGSGDCVAFDEDAAHTTHTAWNEGSETVVLWEAHLYKADAPATTFVNEQGTPES